MMVLVIRHVALEGYKYIRRSGNIVCVFMCKVDIDSWVPCVVPCKRSNCDLCSFGYLRKELEAKSSTGATLFKLNKNFNCNSKNILYLLTCTVCKKQYVGKTENCRFRMNNHKKDVRNPKQKTIFCDKHFKNCLMEKYGELKEPLFFCTPFLYVKDPVKRHNLEQFYIKKFKAELNR